MTLYFYPLLYQMIEETRILDDLMQWNRDVEEWRWMVEMRVWLTSACVWWTCQSNIWIFSPLLSAGHKSLYRGNFIETRNLLLTPVSPPHSTDSSSRNHVNPLFKSKKNSCWQSSSFSSICNTECAPSCCSLLHIYPHCLLCLGHLLDHDLYNLHLFKLWQHWQLLVILS